MLFGLDYELVHASRSRWCVFCRMTSHHFHVGTILIIVRMLMFRQGKGEKKSEKTTAVHTHVFISGFSLSLGPPCRAHDFLLLRLN